MCFSSAGIETIKARGSTDKRTDRPFTSLTSDPHHQRGRNHNLKANLKFWLLCKTRHILKQIWSYELWLEVTLELCALLKSDHRILEDFPCSWHKTQQTWPHRADWRGQWKTKMKLFFADSLCTACSIQCLHEKDAFLFVRITPWPQGWARGCWVLFQIRFHSNNALSIYYFFPEALSDHSIYMDSVTTMDLCPSAWPLSTGTSFLCLGNLWS